MNFEAVALLAGSKNVTLSDVDWLYGRRARRLVARLRSLPEWERLRPTPELAEREWNRMVRKDNEVRKMQRKKQRLQTRLP